MRITTMMMTILTQVITKNSLLKKEEKEGTSLFFTISLPFFWGRVLVAYSWKFPASRAPTRDQQLWHCPLSTVAEGN
jgi:hypothetical protein